MINNLKAVPDNRFGAGEAKFYIARLREKTGQSEQSLLARMVLFAFERMPEFDNFRKELRDEWETSKAQLVETK